MQTTHPPTHPPAPGGQSAEVVRAARNRESAARARVRSNAKYAALGTTAKELKTQLYGFFKEDTTAVVTRAFVVTVAITTLMQPAVVARGYIPDRSGSAAEKKEKRMEKCRVSARKARRKRGELRKLLDETKELLAGVKQALNGPAPLLRPDGTSWSQAPKPVVKKRKRKGSAGKKKKKRTKEREASPPESPRDELTQESVVGALLTNLGGVLDQFMSTKEALPGTPVTPLDGFASPSSEDAKAYLADGLPEDLAEAAAADVDPVTDGEHVDVINMPTDGDMVNMLADEHVDHVDGDDLTGDAGFWNSDVVPSWDTSGDPGFKDVESINVFG